MSATSQITENYTAIVVLHEPPSDWAAGVSILQPPPQRVIIVANGESAIRAAQGAPAGSVVVNDLDNRGIASAYNSALERTSTQWLLFLDQDSEPDPNLIETYARALVQADAGGSIGVITPTVVDRGTRRSSDRSESHAGADPTVRRQARFINSGSLFCVQALRDVGGAWDALRVDLVDSELAIRMSNAGWFELHVPAATLLHRLGSLSEHRLLGFVVFATNHSSERRESIGQGLGKVLRRHGIRDAGSRILIRNVAGNTAAMLLFERDRPKKLRALVRGIACGWRTYAQ